GPVAEGAARHRGAFTGFSESRTEGQAMRTVVATVAAPLLQILADWSLRWAVLVALVALILFVLRPRRTGVRYLLCLAVLFAGLGLPLLPRWGGGFQFSQPMPSAEIALNPKT